MSVHIYITPVVSKKIIWMDCPDCNQRAPFTVLGYEWHGPSHCCLRCGRRWEDCEWMPLDFVRQSRQKSIDAAKKSWKRSVVRPIILNDGTEMWLDQPTQEREDG